MAKVEDLGLLKLALKLDDYDGDDELLKMLWESAEEEVIGQTGRTYEEIVEANGGTFPNRLLNAIMFTAQYDYEHRDGTGNRDNFIARIQTLVRPWQKLSKS